MKITDLKSFGKMLAKAFGPTGRVRRVFRKSVEAKSTSGVCAVCEYRWPLKKDGSPVSHFIYGANGREHCTGSKQLHAPPTSARRPTSARGVRGAKAADKHATPSPR